MPFITTRSKPAKFRWTTNYSSPSSTSLARTLDVIRAMGFEPAQRDSFYQVIQRYDQMVAA
jgi:2-iminoacetate synthase ThiH